MDHRDKQNSQSGQALVEYILIVGISVALILGLMNQLYKPFGAWLDDYMGQYLECLLDVGELPSFGSDLISGECNSKFEKFSGTAGRPPKSSSSGKDSANQSRSNSANANESNRSNDGSGAATIANRNASRRGGDPFTNGKPTGSDSVGKSDGDATLTEKLPETSYIKFRRGAAATILAGERTGRGSTESIFIVDKKKAGEGEGISKKGPVIVEEQIVDSKTKKLLMKPAERKSASEEAEEPWSVSDYLRYGLVFLILIAIILFLIGQAAQISKSMEKNN